MSATMRMLFAVVLCLGWTVLAHAQAAPQPPAIDPGDKYLTWVTPDCTSAPGDAACNVVVRLGQPITLQAAGPFATYLQRTISANGGNSSIALVLNGTSIPHLPIQASDCSKKGAFILCIRFVLVMDPQTDADGKAWNQFLSQLPLSGDPMHLEPKLAVGTDLPVAIRGPVDHPLEFRVSYNNYQIWGTFIGCVAFFVFVFVRLVKSPSALRNADTKCYSLAKSQMAFWGLLILVGFLGVYIATMTMVNIPPQVFVLMGISAATGLGAVALGTGDDRTDLASQLAVAQAAKESITNATPTNSVAINQATLAVQDVNKALTKVDGLKEEKGFKNIFRKFLSDICDDGNGMSFHRLQIVLWTVVLGGVFVVTTMHVFAMPSFSSSLLVLMGISNSTYIGFKVNGQ